MSPVNPIHIAVLPGDGIGQIVTKEALPVLGLFDLPLKMTFADIGWECWKAHGNPIPQTTWQLIQKSDATLLGAITSKPLKEAHHALPSSLQSHPPIYVSPIIQLRQQLDLYANVRPCFSILKTANPFKLCIIRENTEGLYSGLDFAPITDDFMPVLSESKWSDMPKESLSASVRIQSKKGLKRIFSMAFDYAKRHGFSKVTFADKPNVLRQSGAFALGLFKEEASSYPDIEAEVLNVDAVAHWLVKRPESFGVIVAENMFGDILSDVAAAVMGGLGFAPSANIGTKGCYFEPVHGSGLNMSNPEANPCAMFLTIAMMLHHLGFTNHAHKIQQAVKNVVWNQQHVTYDLGGESTTSEMAQAIIKQVRKQL